MTAEAEKFRILLADDHVLIRHGIRNILNGDARMEVVAEAANGQELLAALEKTPVDMIILDISMPGVGGMEVMAQVKGRYPAVRILILTMHKSKEYFFRAMSAGADGYLMKDDPDAELLLAIAKISQGKGYISPQLADDFADDVRRVFRNGHNEPIEVLTGREKEILQLVVQGYTSKKMAKKLNISQRTIDHHRASLLRKFNRKNSVDLVNYAVRHGFVANEP